jgi:hypothetical protein
MVVRQRLLRVEDPGIWGPFKIYEARLRIYAAHQTYPEAVSPSQRRPLFYYCGTLLAGRLGISRDFFSLFLFGFLFSPAKPRGLGFGWRGWGVGGTREDIDGVGKKTDSPSIITPYGALRTPLGRIDQIYPIYLSSTVERPDVSTAGADTYSVRREGGLPNIFMSA